MGCQMGQGWAGSQLQTVLGRRLWGLPLVEHRGDLHSCVMQGVCR